LQPSRRLGSVSTGRPVTEMPDPASGLFRAIGRFAVSIPPVPPQALAAFHMSVGVSILLGDGKRFSGPSFAGARELATLFGVSEANAWIFWGTTLTVVGVIVLFTWPRLEIRHARIALCAVLFGAAPMIFIVLGFITSLSLSEIASTSGIGAYGSLAVAHIHTGIKMIQHGAWDRRRADGCWERRANPFGVKW
jgi:MFS superfamily sulfate permease-like transporter